MTYDKIYIGRAADPRRARGKYKWPILCGIACLFLYLTLLVSCDARAEECKPKSRIVKTVERYYDRNKDRAPNYGQNWKRVLVSFGERDDDTAFSVGEARAQEAVWSGWKPIADELKRLEDCGYDPISARVEADQAQFDAQVQAHQYTVHSLDLAQSRFGSQTGRFATTPTRQDLTEGDATTGIGLWVQLKQNQQPYKSPANLTAAVPLEARKATSTQGGFLYGPNLNNQSWSAWADISTHFNLSTGPQASGVSGDATVSTGWTQDSDPDQAQAFMFPLEVTHVGDSVFTDRYTWYQVRVKGQAATNQHLVLRYQDDDNPNPCTAAVGDVLNCDHRLDIGARFVDNEESKALREGDNVQVRIRFTVDTDYPGDIDVIHTAFLSQGRVCFDSVDFGRNVQHESSHPEAATQIEYWGVHFASATFDTARTTDSRNIGRMCVPYAGTSGWTRTEGSSNGRQWIRLSKIFWVGRPDDDVITGDTPERTWTPVFSNSSVASWPTITYPLTFSVEEDDVSDAELRWEPGKAASGGRKASVRIERHYYCNGIKMSRRPTWVEIRTTTAGAAGNSQAITIQNRDGTSAPHEDVYGDYGRGRTPQLWALGDRSAKWVVDKINGSPLAGSGSHTLVAKWGGPERGLDDKGGTSSCEITDAFVRGVLTTGQARTFTLSGARDATGGTPGYHALRWGRKFVYQPAGNEGFRVHLLGGGSHDYHVPVPTTVMTEQRLLDLKVIDADGASSGTIGGWLKYFKGRGERCQGGTGSASELIVGGQLVDLPDGRNEFTEDMFRLRVLGGTQDLCKGL